MTLSRDDINGTQKLREAIEFWKPNKPILNAYLSDLLQISAELCKYLREGEKI